MTKPGWADTFKRRRLSDGTEQAVLKDSFDREELFALLRPWAAELAIHVGRCF